MTDACALISSANQEGIRFSVEDLYRQCAALWRTFMTFLAIGILCDVVKVWFLSVFVMP